MRFLLSNQSYNFLNLIKIIFHGVSCVMIWLDYMLGFNKLKTKNFKISFGIIFIYGIVNFSYVMTTGKLIYGVFKWTDIYTYMYMTLTAFILVFVHFVLLKHVNNFKLKLS